MSWATVPADRTSWAPLPGYMPQTTLLTLTETKKVAAKIRLETPEEIRALFEMTPYAHRTNKEGLERLRALERLETTIEFVIGVYHKSTADSR